MTNTALLGPWVRRFLLEHLVGERNLFSGRRVHGGEFIWRRIALQSGISGLMGTWHISVRQSCMMGCSEPARN